jgi:hypothetical protein
VKIRARTSSPRSCDCRTLASSALFFLRPECPSWFLTAPKYVPRVRALFRSSEILSRGKRLTGLALDGEAVPDLFIRGDGLYSANLNPENPVGTMQSIEHTLRSLDKLADQEQERSARVEKTLADYQAQANKPFEHETRMKELLVRQAQLNAALDLDKDEKQVALPTEEEIGLADGVLKGPSISPILRRNSAPGISP